MKCLDCPAVPGDGKYAVFLVCKDKVGQFRLCSACWIRRDMELRDIPDEPVKKKKKKKKRKR